jgi:hypothetical protein
MFRFSAFLGITPDKELKHVCSVEFIINFRVFACLPVVRREMERQRQLEWEKQRRTELLQQRQREQERVVHLKAQSQRLAAELEQMVSFMHLL